MMNRDLFQQGAYGKEIAAIYRHLQILVSARLAPLRVGFGQHMFLLMLAKKEGLNQKTLSELLLVDKTTTAKAIRKLEKEGYVRREIDPVDFRNQNIYLTDDGKAIVPKIEEVLAEVMETGLAGIDLDESGYKEFMDLLKVILTNFHRKVRQNDQ